MLFDVIIISDFRFPGGTSTGIAHEIRALNEGGYSVGLLQKRSPVLRRDRDFNPQVAAALGAGRAILIDAEAMGSIECRLAILHNPLVFTEPDATLPRIRTEQAVLLSNHPVTDANGEPYYDVRAVQGIVQSLVGSFDWVPISPLTRRSMENAGLRFAVAEIDWPHVLIAEDWTCDRRRPRGSRPVLGRHSRPEAEKWPETRDEILRVYPDSEEFDVRLLGVGDHLRSVVGEPLPANWTTYEFGEIAPADFLRSIDFFVYYHHPHWVEAFGRNVAEAAASGAVLILPEYLRTTFGDAALYREPVDVLQSVRELHSDWNAYSIQSRKARRAIKRDYSPKRFLHRIHSLIGKPDARARRARQAWLRRDGSARRMHFGVQGVSPSSAFDVVHLGDMQTRRESAWRIANLTGVEAALSYQTGLLNIDIDARRTATIHPVIDEVVRRQMAMPIDPATPTIATKLLLIHGPADLWAKRRISLTLPQIDADKVVALKTDSSVRSLREQDAFLKTRFGRGLRWAATNGEAREALSGVGAIKVERGLWRPAIERVKTLKSRKQRHPDPILGCLWVGPRTGGAIQFAERVARFVAHSEGETTIRLMDPPVEPGALDDFWPERFEIFSGKDMSPWKFLMGLDFLSVLSFGGARAPREEVIAWGMAHGVPVILPSSFEPRIGAGPIYAKAGEIERAAVDMHSSPASYAQLRQRMAETAGCKYPSSTHAARLRRLIGAPAKRQRRATAQRNKRSRVLFLSSNGVGLGHLTRLLAIARRMPGAIEPVFVTFSQAMPVVAQAGYPAEYIPFHVYANSDSHEWNKWLTEHLGQIMRFHDARAVVFDGTTPYHGLIRSVAPSDMKAVWIRRGMWRETHVGRDAISRQRFFDLVIEPADVAESMDRGPTSESRGSVLKVPPISLLDPSELHDRATAAMRLGLDPGRPAVLIQLGSGWNRDLATISELLLRAIAERPGLQPVLVEWLISDTKLDLWAGATRLRGFPVAKYYHAFDFTISAAGYNSFNEIVSFGLPAIFIANQHPMMDDQAARSTYAVDNGAAYQLPETQLEGIGPLLDMMLDLKVRSAMKANCRKLARPNGADLAAKAITRLLG